MSQDTKQICFIYTDTNGLHESYTDTCNVSKKNMFAFARLIAIYYSIGYYQIENGKFKYVETKKVKHILKPKCILFNETAVAVHGITMEKALKKGIDNMSIISELRDDLKKVNIIVSHNLSFHLKAIQTECFRACVNIDFSRFILIDTISFEHNYGYLKLIDLAKKLNISVEKPNHLRLIRKVFDKLYHKYENTLTL